MKFFSYICNRVALDTGMCGKGKLLVRLVFLKKNSYICGNQRYKT